MRRILYADRPYQKGLSALHDVASLAARDAAVQAVEAWAHKARAAAKAARAASFDSAADDMEETARAALEWVDEYLADDLPLRTEQRMELCRAAVRRVAELGGRAPDQCTPGDRRDGATLIEVAARVAGVDLIGVGPAGGDADLDRWSCARIELQRLLRAVRQWKPELPELPPASSDVSSDAPASSDVSSDAPASSDVSSDALPF